MATRLRSKYHGRQDIAKSLAENGAPAPPPPPLPSTTPLSLTTKKKTPYSIKRDYRVLEREKKVTTILSNDKFRAELESILQGQKDGSRQPKKTNLQKLQEDNYSHPPNRVTKATGGYTAAAESVIPIDDLRGVIGSKYTIAEKQTRCKLAAVYRLVEMFGWSQLIYNSITACSPSGNHTVLVNPFGLLYNEVTASRLVAAELGGTVVDPGSTQLGINQHGFAMHAAIHAARSDIKCVVHVHTNAGVAISSMTCGLLPVSEEALSLGEVSYHDGLHLISGQQKSQIAKDLGPTNKVLILRNHGLVAMGRSIEEAFHVTHKLVKACEIQVAMMTAGLNNIRQCSGGVWSNSRPCLGGGDIESTFTILDTISRKWGPGELEFEALMRMLDNKGYNTGYRYKGLSLSESGSGRSGTWDQTDNSPWNFLEQKKIDRTEPVIKNKKNTPRGHKDPNKGRAEDGESSDEREQPNTADIALSPLARAELTAVQVAQSTREAVERLAKDSLLQSPLNHTTPAAHSALLSPLEETAERVARSTGQAVRQLTQDFTTQTLRFPDHVRNGDLETTSEPSLLPGGGYSDQGHHYSRLDHSNTQCVSLKQLHQQELGFPESKTSTPRNSEGRVGLFSIHRSLGSLNFQDGLSPLEKVTHTAERVAGSTGVAVMKMAVATPS